MQHDMSHMYALKSAIEDLLGNQAWLELKETTSLATWRRYVLKLFDAIELSIHSTIHIHDVEWLEDIKGNLTHGRDLTQVAKNIDDLVAALSATLLRQVFLQLGSFPSRKTVKSVPLRSEHWRFNGFRSVQIVQSPQQKEDLFKSKQRRKIGYEVQFDLEAEYRRSRSKLPYSTWCEQRND